MIYFFTGNDHKSLHKKKQDLLTALQQKQSEASIISLSGDDISEESLVTVLETQGLFVEKKIISFSQICNDKNIWEIVKKQLPAFEKNNNIILWSEIHNLPLMPLKKKIEKIQSFAQKTITLDKVIVSQKKESPNLFLFAEDFFTKNKKEVWTRLQKIREKEPDGDKPLNMLLWQNRAMLQVLNSQSVEESGLKPFVHKKAGHAVKIWGEEKTKNSLVSLVVIGREMRMNKKKGYNLLEEYILSR